MKKDMKEYTVLIDDAECCYCYKDFDVKEVLK